jgi:intein/homing endonuclease
MITTIDGLKRIDKIEEGDLVLTSEGYRKVNKLFDNGLRLVEKYSMQFDTFELTLICTPNHKVKTNKGWTEISKLQSGMMVFLNNFIEESHLDYSQVNDTLTMDLTRCTVGYGSKRMGRNDQRDTTSITLMETLGTTESKTYNYLNQTNTLATISKKELKQTENGLLTSKRKASQKLLNGINRLKELNGIKNTQKSITLVSKTMGWETANNVGKNTIEKHHTQNSAILTAKLKHLGCEGSWKERVYDLNVDTTHEYFANGLLVHNCDALRYGIFSKLTIPSVTWGAI